MKFFTKLSFNHQDKHVLIIIALPKTLQLLINRSWINPSSVNNFCMELAVDGERKTTKLFCFVIISLNC